MRPVLLSGATLVGLLAGMPVDRSFAQDAMDPVAIPAIQSFVGGGYGAPNDLAPAEVQQFGRLVGLWDADVELRRQDGSWVKSEPGIWA